MELVGRSLSCSWRRVGLLVFAIVSGIGSAVLAEDGIGLVANGDFEQTTDNLPTGWVHNKSLGGDAQIVTGREHVHSGERAVVLKPNRGPGQQYAYAVLYSELAKIEANRRYRATVWVRGTGTFELGFYQYDPQGTFVGSSALGAIRVANTWCPLVLHYGNSPSKVGSVRLALSALNDGSEIFVDDAALQVVDLPKGPEGPPQDDMQADKVGPGIASGWSGPADRMSIELNKEGRYCQRLDTRISGSDLRGSLRQEDYFNYPIASAVGQAIALGMNAPAFAVEPGATQEISFRARANQIRDFIVELRYFDQQGRMFDINSGVAPIIFLGGVRNGRWSTQRCVSRITSPVTASEAKLSFRCTAGGGSLSVDEVTVRTLISPPVHPALFTAEWLALTEENTQEEDAPSAPTPQQRRVIPAASVDPLPLHPQVIETSETLTVLLTNGVRLRLRRQGEKVSGLEEVSLNGVNFRNPQAPPAAPLIETVEGGKYVACLYRGHAVGERGDVTIKTVLQDATGGLDDLDWIFAPHEVKVDNLSYRGFAVSYKFRSGSNHVLRIVDRATWELGGTPIGLTVVDQDTYADQNAFLITENSPYCSGSGVRFVAGECLDYQFAPEGALFAYFEKPCFVRYQRIGTPEFVLLNDSHQFAATSTATTTAKHILFAESGNLDRWLQARDFVYSRARQHAGIAKDTPLPIANVWTDWRELAKIGKKNYYQKIIDDYLPTLAKLGLKRIMIHETWEHGGCSPSDLKINSAFGGEPSLKKLCDAAKVHGMEVIAWNGPGHLWSNAPLLKEHPEFLLKGRGNEPPTTYSWPDVTGVDLSGPWFDYAIDKLRGIRERTGLGGFWLDSYINFTHNVKCATRELEIKQADSLARFHSRIHQLGYVTYTEASSNFGIKSNGLPVSGLDSPAPNWPAAEEFADTSPYAGEWKEGMELRLAEGLMQGDRYFRYIANKCIPFIYWRRFRDHSSWIEKTGAANKAYNAVVQFMDKRKLLPEDKGVLWTSDDGKVEVVFAFTQLNVGVAEGRKAYVSPQLAPVALVGRRFVAEAGKVYIVR